ncbi:MAG: hypothetical protein ACUVRK_00740 [Spirochaetota bacterium]
MKVSKMYNTIIFLTVTIALYALQFADIHGRWQLLYRGNYGYEFRFYKNYQALCIIYMQTNAVVFKGVYTFENPQTIRININQMKNTDTCCDVNTTTGFAQVKSSYFLFNASITTKNSKKMLELKPLSIVIDGINSEGYFEPVIVLQRM